ncbi:hypothetical protein B0J13DRAFT_564067 [Dactylonectria estremocensis]|uniref:Uncharacterized protein n=1 Tax=Dactylonectria estremocensis TaxID=1079267 RepID=A0A9P9E106_9HYPO|nr:hypothetical protein B0J13DRAFT_564067 [Dactylonectria estremocensis]
MAESSALATPHGSSPWWSFPDDHNPPTITKFIFRFLTGPQTTQISQQFRTSWHRNRQIMWTGNIRSAAQTWADRREMRTLSTAMGSLVNGDNPMYPQASKGKGRSRYMRGASALFAWYIATEDDVVTILCPPPPDRFNPGGGTNMQLVELPILMGIVGGRAMSRIEVVHPMVPGAEDFRYQLWPVGEVGIWIERFATVAIQRSVWLQRSRTGQVRTIEKLLRSTTRGSEEDAVYRAILHDEGSVGVARVTVVSQSHQGGVMLEAAPQQKGMVLHNGKVLSSEQPEDMHVDCGNLPATQSKTPKNKKKKKRKAGVAIVTKLATIAKGDQDEKLKTQPQASDEKKETEAPSGTGEGTPKSAAGKVNEANTANTAPQSQPMVMGTLEGLAEGGSSSQEQSHTSLSKKWSKMTSPGGMNAATRCVGKKFGQKIPETVATIPASAATSNAEIDDTAAPGKTDKTNEVKEARKKTKKEARKKRKEERRKKREEKKENKLKPRGPWMLSTNMPGQTACCCIVCKTPRAPKPTISPFLMESKARDNVLLALTMQKLRAQSSAEGSSRLVDLSVERSGAELCLRPAQVSLFVVPTASWLALERVQCGRK